MDFYQDAGIWIVIASCVAEYLLLITYIAVAAYEFFKNRKITKMAAAQPPPSRYIKYTTAQTPIPSKNSSFLYSPNKSKSSAVRVVSGSIGRSSNKISVRNIPKK
jgi:hypothetical protein